MGGFLQDLRFGSRMLLRRPGFTVLAAVIIAVGTGATTSIFSVFNGIILRPLPFPDSDRLVRIHSTDDGGRLDNWSGPNFLDFKSQCTSLDGVAGYCGFQANMTEGDYPEVRRGRTVTADFFSVLGVEAFLGRTISPSIDTSGEKRVVVLSYGFWRSQFGGDPDVLGKSIQLNEDPYTVVGVMPSGFDFPDETDLWTSSRYRVPEPPFDLGDDPSVVRGAEYFDVLGRLASGATLEEAAVEASTIGQRLAEAFPDTNVGEGIFLQPLLESEVGAVRPMLIVFSGAVGFVFLIACANVANLLLARATRRQRELAIRVALGADRFRVVRLLVTESILLALLGGLAGFLLAVWGTDALLAVAPEEIPRVAEVRTDLHVLGFSFLIALAAGTLLGLVPAVQSFGKDVHDQMRGGGERSTAWARRSFTRNLLIVAEVAISLVLVLGAGLMIRTLASLNSVDPGFAARDALTARLFLPSSKYPDETQMRSFYRDVLERVRSLPSIKAAGAVLSLPIRSHIQGILSFNIQGRPAEPGQEPVAGYQMCTPGYFETMGIPLLRGRLFDERDRDGSPPVVILSRAFATHFWPDTDPLGQRLTWDDPDGEDVKWFTVIGIVGNTRHDGLDGEQRRESYIPYDQAPLPYMTLVVKSGSDSAATAAALRKAVMAVDPAQPLTAIHSMEELMRRSLQRRRFNMLLMNVFAGIALLMAGLGLYGVLSYSVAQRSREIGLRMALGAREADVVAQVMREGGRLAALGAVVGIGGALGLARLITSLVHGVSPTDPLTFLIGLLVLVCISLLACCLPAYRAARVNPVVSLRAE